MNHSKVNNHSSKIKGKQNEKWTAETSVYISANCFDVFESSSFRFVGFGAKQVTLVAATSMVSRFAVSRAMSNIETL